MDFSIEKKSSIVLRFPLVHQKIDLLMIVEPIHQDIVLFGNGTFFFFFFEKIFYKSLKK